MLDLFAERLAAVDAHLWVVDSASALPGLVGERAQGLSVVAWEEALALLSAEKGLGGAGDVPAPGGQEPADIRARAAEADVSLIVADVGIAETGQIGFAHDERRPREVALLPDRQIALLPRRNLVLNAHQALQQLNQARSIILIAGPSRTADIEQRMMLGVHAPRSLDVIVFG